MEDIKFIRGNINVRSGNHKVKEIVAFASENWEKNADSVISGDLLITDKYDTKPYIIYCASGEVTVYGEEITGLQYPKEIERVFLEEINNLRKLRIQKIDDELVDVMNRQIYIGVVGAMEFFLCEFLLSFALGVRKYFNKYSDFFGIKNGRIQDKINNRIIHDNYHRIADVQIIYKEVLQIEFPPIENLRKLVLTRHDLVHRNGYTNGTSAFIKISAAMIDDLINEVNNLVSFIVKSKQPEVEGWVPTF
jgi:hypothetical protein